MIPDHACVPGLDRPVTVSEYAQLEGLSETLVLALVRELKIRKAAYFRGQWFIEAPRNCEARLAQLRGEQPTPRNDKVNVSRNDKGNIPALEDKEFWARIESEAESYDTPTDAEQSVTPQRNEHLHGLQSEPEPQPRRAKEILSVDELRISIGRTIWGYDDLTDAEKKALLNKPECANYPQPIDYDLTRDDMNLHAGQRVYRVKDDVRYKEGRQWFGVFLRWKGSGNAGVLAFFLLLIGTLSVVNKDSRETGFILLGAGLACVLYAMLPGAALACVRPCASLREFEEAFRLHNLYEIAAYDAQLELLKRKRSYWELLDGYAFEGATAEVLRKHQFTATVTRGSGDGGVDIEVTRNGLRGVVQCKAHINCVGPSVVRDLYGVIHHSRAAFGIVVSRGGFTKGAADFARDKPILFLDTDDLIAMQEGRDVLAKAFAASLE